MDALCLLNPAEVLVAWGERSRRGATRGRGRRVRGDGRALEAADVHPVAAEGRA